MNKKTNDFDDIENLNEEIYKAEEATLLNDDEKKEMRKHILLLIGVVCLFAVILILVNVVWPSFKKTKKEKPAVVEEKKLSLAELEDGEINLDNAELQEYINFIDLDYHDNTTINLLSLYQSKFKFYELSDQIKFFYFVNSNSFKNYLRKKDKDNCLINYSLNKEEIDKLIQKQLNISLSTEIKLNTIFKFNNNSLSAITYNNDSLSINCQKHQESSSTSYIKSQVESAIKTGDTLVVYQKAFFMNIDGIFKDTEFNQIITNNPNTDYNIAFKEANTYKFIFKETNGKYYLYERE